jgi:outer membrane protein LpxR
MLLLLASVVLTAQGASPDLRDLSVFRFDFDNDVLLGKDNSFTAGWSLQVHSRLNDVWGPGNAKWIGRVPGLGDGGRGGPITRWAVGIAQVIITPKDVGIAAPQPNDAPWAGMLGAAVSWSAYDNRRMAGLQVYAGCLGPCSAAEPVQKFVHGDLGLGPSPKGWDNQLVNQALFNVNYEYRYKLFADRLDRYYTPGRLAHDLSVGGHVGLGNLETVIWGQVEYRFGWGLPLGFTKAPDPPGWGIMLDPVYADPAAPPPSRTRGLRAYVSLMGRVAHFTYMAPAEGGRTVNGGEHPKLRPYPGRYVTLAGLHVARLPFTVHITHYRYYRQGRSGIAGSSDWINMSFEYRF